MWSNEESILKRRVVALCKWTCNFVLITSTDVVAAIIIIVDKDSRHNSIHRWLPLILLAAHSEISVFNWNSTTLSQQEKLEMKKKLKANLSLLHAA